MQFNKEKLDNISKACIKDLRENRQIKINNEDEIREENI